jgi:hypothetical protein
MVAQGERYLFSEDLGEDETKERLIAWYKDHFFTSSDGIVHNFGERKEYEYESIWIYDGQLCHLLQVLMDEHGFEWRWAGWDQEPRFVRHGIVRAAEKVVRDYEGKYVISPRCHKCGDKTGWCKCFLELQEAIDEAAEKHTCDSCYDNAWMERIEADWKKDGKFRDTDIIHWYDGLEETLKDSIEWAKKDDTKEYLKDNQKKLRDLHRLSAMDYLKKYEDEWWEHWQEVLSDCDPDEDSCECPLEGVD